VAASADLLLSGERYLRWRVMAGSAYLTNSVGDSHNVIAIWASLALLGLCCDDCPTIWHGEFLTMFEA
jgi:hypothetical protein